MAKVFRNIRLKFIEKNKVKKYLLYAIGEIILIIIGILTALQINHVNQEHQQAKLERVLLKQIRFEILEIYEDIWRDTENLKLGNESHYRINQYINENLPYRDSLCFDFYWLKNDEYVFPTNATYSRIKDEGLDIIKNDTIRVALQSLYEGYFPRLIIGNSAIPDISSLFHEYYLDSFKPNSDLDLNYKFQLPEDTVGSRIYADVYYEYPNIDKQNGNEYTMGYVPLDFQRLKEDPKFLMLLEQSKRYRDIKIRHYLTVKSTVKLAISTIERELKE